MFIIFLEPLLRWIEKDDMGYHFNTSPSTCTNIAYVDDLAIMTEITYNTSNHKYANYKTLQNGHIWISTSQNAPSHVA